jgi:hypothetical protein
MKFKPFGLVLVVLLPCLGISDYLITTSDSLLNNSADYLIITHNNFTSALYPLCQLRESLGFEVKMAEVSLIYSTFNSGPRTDRIKAFLQRVYDYWATRPSYVLLVGDACKDTTLGDYVPVKRFPKFSYYYYGGLQEHSPDNWYVQLDGPDYIPDLIIGRLPVNTFGSAESLVSKIIHYETSPDTGLWLSTTMLLASTDRLDHAEQIDSLYLQPAGDSVYKVYENQGNSAYLRAKTRDGFNQGASLLCQITHGGLPPAWGGSRTIFSYQDVDSLRNIDRLPIVLGRG